jgi:hypothetical protein
LGYNRRDMATNFPTSLDNLTNPAGSDPVNNPSHASQHANLNDAIEVLEAKVGVNNSAVTTSLDYRVKQLETNPVASYTNEEAVDAVALALAAGTHSNITINYNDTGNSISISAAAGYTDEEARDAVALALRGSGGITISSDDTANTITISVDNTIATKTYVDTAVSNLGNTSDTKYVPVSEVGQPDGIATLDANSRIPLSQLGNLVDGAPAALDTLNELSAAINDDASYAAGITTALGLKAPIASPTFTGTVTIPTGAIITGPTMTLPVINNVRLGYTSTPTAAGTTTLTVDSNAQQRFTGTASQNVALPLVSTLVLGQSFYIDNNSSGVVNVNSSGGNLVAQLPGGTAVSVTCVSLTGTTATSWRATFQAFSSITGTGSNVLANSPTFTGTPAAPTATTGTNSTQIATTAFVKTEISNSVQPGAVYQTSAPSSPAVGQIWIDSDEDVTTFDSNIIRRKAITATAGQTVFTADLPFIDGFEQIFMNGLLLVKTTDYATSGGNTVTLTSAAAASDIIEIVSVTGANSVDTYTQAETNALLAANTSVAPLSISANTTLVAKKRYFVTSASALTLTLPASPALNDEIQILDASGNSSTYNITVARNANKINGGNNNLIIDTNGGWYTLLYTGSTYGWKVG